MQKALDLLHHFQPTPSIVTHCFESIFGGHISLPCIKKTTEIIVTHPPCGPQNEPTGKKAYSELTE